MSKTKFPAQFLSAYDIGKRVRVVTTSGATITDTLTGIKAGMGSNGNPSRLLVTFESVTNTDQYGRGGGIEVSLDSWVKRISK